MSNVTSLFATLYYNPNTDKFKKVLSFDNLTLQKVREILDKYSHLDGITFDKVDDYFELFKNKKYCLLIFLKNVQLIRPFNITKTGFGAMSAWITIENIDTIRMSKPVVAERLGDSL